MTTLQFPSNPIIWQHCRTNAGTKDIPDLDVVLKGGFDVYGISVSSSNASPTVLLCRWHLQQLTR